MEFVRPNENIYISFCYAPVLVNLGVALSCWMGEQLQTPDELAFIIMINCDVYLIDWPAHTCRPIFEFKCCISWSSNFSRAKAVEPNCAAINLSI